MDDEIEEAMRRLQRNFIRGYYVGPSDVGGWIVSDGSRSGHVTPESISSWRLVESAPMPVVETMIVPHEQAQAAREYLGAKYGVPHATRYTESPPADALNRWESRRHNAHCTRCYGPAFHGAGALRCERVGGCLADVEPKVDAIDASADLRDAAPDADVWEMSGRENYWLADGCDGRYAAPRARRRSLARCGHREGQAGGGLCPTAIHRAHHSATSRRRMGSFTASSPSSTGW